MIPKQSIHRYSSSRLPRIVVRLPTAFTWIEVGIIAIFVFGAFLGAFKRYIPVLDSIISLAYDFLCFGLLSYVLLKRLLRSRRLPYSHLTWPIFIFAGYVLLTIFFPTVSSLGRGILGWRFLVSGIFLHFLGFYAFDDVRRIWRVMAVFWLTGGIVAIYGLVQLWRGYTAVELQWIQQLAATMSIAGTGRYRLMSTMGSAVDFGFFLALTIVTLFAALIFKRHPKRWGWATLLLMGTALIFTYVRAAWIAVFVGGVYVIITYLWHIKQIRLLYPVLIVLFFFFIGLLPFAANAVVSTFDNPALQERVGSLSNPLQDKSMQDRFDKWEEIGNIISNYPIGIGVGMTGAASLKYNQEPRIAPVTIDNSYLKVIVETGWLGFGLFLWLLFSVIWGSRQVMRIVQGEQYILAVMFTASFIAFVLIMFLGEYIELNPSRSIIWIFTGFLFSLPRLPRRSARLTSG